MKRFFALALLLLATALLSACPEDTPTFDDIYPAAESLQRKTSEAADSAGEEVNKVFTFEYRVLDIPQAASRAHIERELNAAGQEMWECFDMKEYGDSFRFFCKRRPKTYLRYIPRLF